MEYWNCGGKGKEWKEMLRGEKPQISQMGADE